MSSFVLSVYCQGSHNIAGYHYDYQQSESKQSKNNKRKKMELPTQRNMKTVHFARESLIPAILKESTQIHQEYSSKLYTQQDSKTATECSPSEIFPPQHINGCGLLQHFKLISLVDTAETLAREPFCCGME